MSQRRIGREIDGVGHPAGGRVQPLVFDRPADGDVFPDDAGGRDDDRSLTTRSAGGGKRHRDERSSPELFASALCS